MEENIIIGIVSGLFTTFLVVVLKSIWDNTLLPWYEKRIYKDVLISGKWESKYTNNNYGKETITVKQTAHNIKGTIITISGEDKGNIYTFEGIFKNLILTASYSSDNKTNIDRGNITLRIGDNGNSLIGYCSLYDDDEQKIESSPYTWKRKI